MGNLILIGYLFNSCYLCFIIEVVILFYSRAAFGPRPPPLFGWQTRKLSATNQQWSLWLYAKHLLDVFPRFWISRPSTFKKYLIFHPLRGFSANNFTSGNVTLYNFLRAKRPSLIPWHMCQMSSLLAFILIFFFTLKLGSS